MCKLTFINYKRVVVLCRQKWTDLRFTMKSKEGDCNHRKKVLKTIAYSCFCLLPNTYPTSVY